MVLTTVLGMYPEFGDPFEQKPGEGEVSLYGCGSLITSLEVLHTPQQHRAVVETQV